MDTDAKNKRQNEKAEDELIRHLLLQAEAEEYREVLANAPPAPRHSRAYRWPEERLLATEQQLARRVERLLHITG